MASDTTPVVKRKQWKRWTGLAIVGAIGLLALAVGWRWRHQMLAEPGVAVAELPREEVLRLKDKARGPMQMVSYMDQDAVRVASFAVARDANGNWSELAAGRVLTVTGTMNDEAGEPWVRVRAPGSPVNQIVVVHASFLERYMPVVLDKTIELSGVRLLTVREQNTSWVSVTGWLRNISSRTISQCVVTCVFQDKNEREVDVRRQELTALPPLDLVRFQAGRTDKAFASIAVQITHATPEGLRNYLSTVVIQRSNMQ